MKKLLFIIAISTIVLSSCNFPLSHRSNQLSEDYVSTHAAETLQAYSTQTPVAVATITSLPVISATPLPTNTEAITPTSTTSPDDPRLTLGTPTFTDSFTSGSAFGLKSPYSDDAITMSVSDGALSMKSSRLRGGTRWRLAYLTPRNFYLEGTFKTVNCSGSDFYGMVLRSPDYSSGIGYYYALNCAGQYSLMRMNGEYELVKVIDWTSDSAILTGSGQENRIGIMANDSHFSIYINGKLVTETDNDVIKEKGHYGVFQSAMETPNMTVEVEEINEWDRP